LKNFKNIILRLIFFSLLLLAGAVNAKDMPDTLEQRVMACTACHGLEGRANTGDYYPRIAGKPEGY